MENTAQDKLFDNLFKAMQAYYKECAEANDE